MIYYYITYEEGPHGAMVKPIINDIEYTGSIIEAHWFLSRGEAEEAISSNGDLFESKSGYPLIHEMEI